MVLAARESWVWPRNATAPSPLSPRLVYRNIVNIDNPHAQPGRVDNIARLKHMPRGLGGLQLGPTVTVNTFSSPDFSSFSTRNMSSSVRSSPAQKIKLAPPFESGRRVSLTSMRTMRPC